MDFGSNVYLKRYLREFKDDHPLLTLFGLNQEYMEFFDKLLGEIDSIPNLNSKIKQMRKDSSNWESIVSELEFARKIKALNPKFVSVKGSPSPDICIDCLGEQVYFEVKLLADTEEASRVYREIWAVESDFRVEIVYENLDQDKPDKANRLIDFVKKKIQNHQTGSFEVDGHEVRIQKKISAKSSRTALIMRSKEAFLVPLELLKRGIFRVFYDKILQFSAQDFVFWVIDVQRSKYGLDFFKAIVYGNTVSDKVVGLKHYVGFEDIYQIYLKNPELFNNTDIVPEFTYPKKDGLFFLKDAKCLNGIIIKSRGRTSFLLNPFADPQLDINIIRKLKNFFEK